MVDLRQLRYFVAVVEEGQVTRAADRLHLAQPALSQAIAQLERELGVSLLIRRPRGVEPTEAGQAFFARALESLDAAQSAVAEASVFARDANKRLILGFLPGLLACATPLMSAFASAHPDVEVQPRELDFAGVLAKLRAGEVDAEVTLPAPPAAVAEDLAVQPIGAVPLALYVSNTHALARRASVCFHDFADEPHPSRHPDIPEYWADCYWLTAQRGHRPRVAARQPRTPDEVWHLVASGECVSIGPAYFAPYLQEVLGTVVAVGLDDVPPASLALTTKTDDKRATVRKLVEVARTIPPA